MDIREFQFLIDRYLSGEATAAEKDRVENWLDHRHDVPHEITPADRRRLEQEILGFINRGLPGGNTVSLLTRLKPILRIAAILTFMAGAALVIYRYRQAGTPHPVFAEYHTDPGKKALLTLSDGSIIHLNGGTHIRYYTHNNDSLRRIYLQEGEAFFEVVHKARQPFLVYSGNLKVQVLGTSFDVSHYAYEQKTIVAVRSGKVGVSRMINGKTQLLAMLTPDQMMTDLHSGRVITGIGGADRVAWMNNVLQFRDEDYRQVAGKLESWFGIRVHLKRLGDTTCRFTARFDNPSLGLVLKSLQRINMFRYQQQGKKLDIDNLPCH